MSGTVFNFPTNIVITIVVAMAVTGVGAWLILSQTLRTFPSQVQGRWRWGTAVTLAAWFTVLLGLATNPPGGQVLGMAYLIGSLVFGITIGLTPLVLSSTFRKVVRAIPPLWIVDINTFRVIGVVFLALVDMKLLPPQFALPAGYGDLTVGVLALAITLRLEMRQPYSRIIVVAWNLLGLLDFTVALITGATFIAPFANQLAAQGGSLLYLNYMFMIPFFGVPLFIVLHIYSLFQIASTRTVEVTARQENPAQRSVYSS